MMGQKFKGKTPGSGGGVRNSTGWATGETVKKQSMGGLEKRKAMKATFCGSSAKKSKKGKGRSSSGVRGG